ncbi:uncharacterized protein LOC111408626 [Olea europaea subsp. europaea]|uniref:Uncharacterized protein LOC111408626 n=1 Tax=Olea europaea subsp. europaea TaxID=158383 RepID=A0A8S0QAW1_OLEEU|nr:uncharacterized protein LOC111408626 [Olea europaea subsp. europaea]
MYRNYFKSRNYDPIDFEKFGIYGTWVLEEEPPTLVEDELEVFRRELGECTIQSDKNDDELHFDDLDLDDCENFGNGNENTSDTNNGNEDFSMTETPSFIQGEGIEEFMSETPAWMRSNSS